MNVNLICKCLLLITCFTIYSGSVYAKQTISGYLLFEDGSKQEFVALIRIDFDGQTAEGRKIINKDKKASLLIGHKEKEIKVLFNNIREIDVISYDLKKTGDNDIYLENGTFNLVTTNKTYKNLLFQSFYSVDVKVVEELTGEIHNTTFQAGTFVKSKPEIQIRKIILSN